MNAGAGACPGAGRAAAPAGPVPARVVVLNDDTFVRGGAAALALRQASLLAARGIDVGFVAGDAGAAPELDAPGVERLALGAPRLRDAPRARAFVQGIWHRRAGDAVARLVARDAPDTVYHLHNWQTILSPATLAALRPVAPRVWLHAHDYFLCCPNGAFHHFPEHRECRLVPLSVRCVASNCDRTSRAEKAWRVARQAALTRAMAPCEAFAGAVLLHETMREPFERSGWSTERLHVVPNPAPPAPAERIAAESNRNWLFTGRLEHGKGIGPLLEAADRAGIPIDVAGDGELRDALARRHPAARLHGWLDRAGLDAALGRARFALVPTLQPEPFGLVIVEALLAGVPVLVSRSAALADAIVAAGAGIACDPHDPARLARQLEALARLDDGAVRTMSEAARALGPRLAASESGWIDALLELYARCLPGGVQAPTSPEREPHDV